MGVCLIFLFTKESPQKASLVSPGLKHHIDSWRLKGTWLWQEQLSRLSPFIYVDVHIRGVEGNRLYITTADNNISHISKMKTIKKFYNYISFNTCTIHVGGVECCMVSDENSDFLSDKVSNFLSH